MCVYGENRYANLPWKRTLSLKGERCSFERAKDVRDFLRRGGFGVFRTKVCMPECAAAAAVQRCMFNETRVYNFVKCLLVVSEICVCCNITFTNLMHKEDL